MYARLKTAIRSAKSEQGKCYASILLIQLRNGSRISEAAEAYLRFLESGRDRVQVRVRKRKDGAVRLMVIPPEVYAWRGALERTAEQLAHSAREYARQKMGINTHSLRYAFITYALMQGMNPAVVAGMTGHAKLDYILRYTQRKAAEELLESML